MHLLFDDAGKPTTGRILSEADHSLQVELDSGKRVKVKSAHAWLRFEKPEPHALMSQALALQSGMELPLAYEFAPEDEFDFAALASVYFDEPTQHRAASSGPVVLAIGTPLLSPIGQRSLQKSPRRYLGPRLGGD